MPRRLLELLTTDGAVVTVIVLNAAALFVEAFPGLDPGLATAAAGVDLACSLYFVFEVITKISLRGWRGYWSQGWNRFDFIVVALSSPGLLLPTHELRVLAVCRVARLLRFFRLLRFIPNADHLWLGIRRALRASIGIVLAGILYNIILGLVACYLFGGPDHPGSEHFSDPLVSIYSLFKIFTLEGWYEIPEAIAAAHGHSTMWAGFVRLFFAFAVVSGGMLGVSLMTAVFVDEMVIDNTADLEERFEGLAGEIGASREALVAEIAALERRLSELVAATRRVPRSSDPPAAGD